MDKETFNKFWAESIRREDKHIANVEKNIEWMRGVDVFNAYKEKHALQEMDSWAHERAECRRSELADAIQILRERGKVI